jgi:hypothetical protein
MKFTEKQAVKRDHSISIGSATVYILILLIPLMVLLIFPYTAMWGLDNFLNSLIQFMDWSSFVPAILIGVIVHELIHGFAWALFGKVPFRKIQFGLKALTPYAHCRVPIRAQAYRMGAVMPTLLLGILPYVIGLTSGAGWFTVLGLVYIFAGGGDLLVLWTLRGVDGESWVMDHPSRAGCYVLEENQDHLSE